MNNYLNLFYIEIRFQLGKCLKKKIIKFVAPVIINKTKTNVLIT